jgi:mycobactin lysine-N-oxygenase
LKTKIVRLAIMGAGPKAAAIVAKAHVINCIEIGGAHPVRFEIDVFDPKGIGAHWTGGKAGYTDGAQALCTPIERDLGFPFGATELCLMSR